MELLPLLRWGSHRRLILAGALIVSIAAFVALGDSGSSGTSTAVAWTQVTLDTPQSQLAAAAPTGANTLVWRASLLVHLMATNASTRELAGRLGVSGNELSVVDPSLAVPSVPTSMAVASAKAASLATTPYTLTVFLAEPGLPVISIEAAAPQAAEAKRLAAAAVAVLASHASPGGRFISPIRTDADPLSETLQPFGIDQVAPIQAKLLPASTLSLKAIVAALFLFLLCTVLGSRLQGRRRPRPRALAV